MSKNKGLLANKSLLGAVSLMIAVAVFVSLSSADHQWGKFKWKISGPSLNLSLGDNVDSNWDGHLLSTSTDWSTSTVVDTFVVPGSKDPSTCDPTAGSIEVCNAEYGTTGWLGIAQIYGRGNTITAGVAKLNDTYFNTAFYNTQAWKQMVMCQEVAHGFGLGHQDETFANANLGTCMDYTDDPDGSAKGQLSNEHPNQHDYDQLKAIYGESKKGGGGKDGGGCNPKSPKCNPQPISPNDDLNHPSQWGKAVAKDGQGRNSLYVRNLGNGEKMFTHVIWAK